MTLNFNTTYAVKPNETLQAAEVRIYKAKLTADEIAALEERCDLSQLKVQLYLKLHSNGGENDSIVLEQTATLQQMKLEQDEYFVFSNMTRLYQRMVQDSQHYMLSLRVAIAQPCSVLHPEDIGFISGEGKEALIVGFSKSSVSLTEALARQGMQLLAGTQRRRKRQAVIAANPIDTMVGGSSKSRTRTRHSTRVEETSELRENISDYYLHPCRLYTHTVSLNLLIDYSIEKKVK